MDIQYTPVGLRAFGQFIAESFRMGDPGPLLCSEISLHSPNADDLLPEMVTHPIAEIILVSVGVAGCFLRKSKTRSHVVDVCVPMKNRERSLKVCIVCLPGRPVKLEAWILDWEAAVETPKWNGIAYMCRKNAKSEHGKLWGWVTMVGFCAGRRGAHGCIAATLPREILHAIVCAGMGNDPPKLRKTEFFGYHLEPYPREIVKRISRDL
jgi:hypothetical protein